MGQDIKGIDLGFGNLQIDLISKDYQFSESIDIEIVMDSSLPKTSYLNSPQDCCFRNNILYIQPKSKLILDHEYKYELIEVSKSIELKNNVIFSKQTEGFDFVE